MSTGIKKATAMAMTRMISTMVMTKVKGAGAEVGAVTLVLLGSGHLVASPVVFLVGVGAVDPDKG